MYSIQLTLAERAKKDSRIALLQAEQAIKKASSKKPRNKQLKSIANLIKFK